MTLGAFLTACNTQDALITVADGTDVIAKLSPVTVGTLSSTATAYTITAFTITSNKEIAVTVSTS